MFNDDSNSATVSNSAPVSPVSTPAPTGGIPAQAQAPAPNTPAAQPQQPTQQPQSQGQTVSNPAPVQPQQQPIKHPWANRIRDVAEVLSGGPSYAIDDQGNRKPVPISGKQIGLAIALEALSGGFAGLAAGRGRGPGAAGVAGMQLGQQQVQQRRNQEQEAFETRSKALARQAAVFETNSRTTLNTAEAEKYGSDAIDKMVEINRASGVLDADSSNLDNGGQPMTQAELQDAMHSGKIHSTDQLGPIAGRVEITNADGTKRWEATHLIIKDPNAPTTLTQEDWDRYAAGNVKGFPAGVNIGTGTQVPLRIKQLANEQLAAHTMADYRLKDIRDTLAGTQYADKVPARVDFSQPGIDTAMQRFQKYVSHSNMHGMDVYESLQQMGADKRDPKTGAMQPNQDAKYVDTVAQALGGWPVLKALHDKLESDTAGQKAGAEAQAKSNVEVDTQKRLIPIKAQAAGEEEKARQQVKTAAAQISARNDDGSWNMGSIPVQLVEGNVAPSQLSKWGRERYDAAIQTANEYSMAKYGHPFDMAGAEIDYKFATNTGTQNTLKYLNSLTGADNKTGNLGALVSLSNQISRTDFPSLNDAAAWAKLQTGNQQMASYYTAVVEVADQVAKILQGGGSGNGTSDAKLKQAAELFDKGFSKDQITGVAQTLRTLLANRKTELIGGNRYLLKQFGQQSSAAVQPVYARNPQTNQRAVSYDGGHTWQAAQ